MIAFTKSTTSSFMTTTLHKKSKIKNNSKFFNNSESPIYSGNQIKNYKLVTDKLNKTKMSIFYF